MMDDCHFCFSNLKGKDTRYANSLMVHVKHYIGSLIEIFLKHRLQDHDYEIHGSIIVIVEQHFIKWWFL